MKSMLASLILVSMRSLSLAVALLLFAAAGFARAEGCGALLRGRLGAGALFARELARRAVAGWAYSQRGVVSQGASHWTSLVVPRVAGLAGNWISRSFSRRAPVSEVNAELSARAGQV